MENYPQLLIEVTLDHDLAMREFLQDEGGLDDFMVQNPGVDICFKVCLTSWWLASFQLASLKHSVFSLRLFLSLELVLGSFPKH